ncbi:hypothetical protein GCM10023085_74590 [Actinomadura viridis]|uniref:Secreted protein n=1 Tax=Actinomadura viridis TaxID=58110 RepID=A0A931DEY9_9ACTN|nr:hypothetical protein [Actinomadura viridis]MBG6087579.1 hypothetical protein [Actinomadura viridis]
MKKPSVRAMAVAGIAFGAVLAPAAPAWAASVGCTLGNGAYSCSTGYVAASSRITISVLGTSGGKTVTCIAYDPNVVERGRVSNSSPTTARSVPFNVPNNRHRLVCTRTVTTGGGWGQLYNF